MKRRLKRKLECIRHIDSVIDIRIKIKDVYLRAVDKNHQFGDDIRHLKRLEHF